MGILERIFLAGLAALAGCYAPSVRDCTVSCDSPGDCADNQICNTDHLCVARMFTGRCMAVNAPPDASVDAPGPDGPEFVTLHVQIIGRGAVLVVGRGTCISDGNPHERILPPNNCTYDIMRGVAQQAIAIEIPGPKQSFAGWASQTCAGQDQSCTFTLEGPATLVAQFGSDKKQQGTDQDGHIRAPSEPPDARAAAPRSRNDARLRSTIARGSRSLLERLPGPQVAPHAVYAARDHTASRPFSVGDGR